MTIFRRGRRVREKRDPGSPRRADRRGGGAGPEVQAGFSPSGLRTTPASANSRRRSDSRRGTGWASDFENSSRSWVMTDALHSERTLALIPTEKKKPNGTDDLP